MHLRTKHPTLGGKSLHEFALRAVVALAAVVGMLSSAQAEVYWVNSTSDGHDANPGDGVCATDTGCCTFRAAVEEANATTNEYPRDVVSIPLGLYRLTLGSVKIEDGVTIRGDGSCRTVIDGNDASGILVVDADVDEMINIRDLTLQNGNADTGGALRVDSEDSFIQCFDVVFRNNFGYSWGGAIKTRSSLYMTDCTVNNNETLARGGGIDASASAHVELNRCTISYNKANQGGGIRVLGTMDATNSTFSNNHADFTGGGILNVGTTHLGSCTVAFNTAYDVGGGVNNYSGNVSIWNTIIALNEATSDGDDLYGQVKWEVKNLLGTGDGATVYDEPYNAMIGDDVSPIDPELDATLASNGALTRTHALLYGSPAIDAGSTATPGGGALFACEDEDQRKFLRATDGDYDGDAVCDLGAYEYNSSLPPSDGGGGIDDKVTSSGSSSGCLPGYYGGLAVALADDFANLTHQVQAVEWTGGFETLTTIEREQCGTRYALADPDTLAVMTQKTTTGTDGLASKTREASTLSLASSDSRSLMTRSANAVAAPEAGDVSAPAVEFRRGDTDGSGALGLNDAIAILFWQFAGGDEPGCLDAADADDDGTLGVGDPFAILDRLFLDGSPLPAPGSASCGPDATADGLGCANPGELCAE